MQPGCLFAGWAEPYPSVHAAIAALTAGPVAPGDAVGAGGGAVGLEQQPVRPATPPDSYWAVRAFGAWPSVTRFVPLGPPFYSCSAL